MAAPFTMDGVQYNVVVPAGGLKRKFKILDGENAGRSLDGTMDRDIIGTYYNYDLNLETSKSSLEEYDRLYEQLSAPVDYHTITFPYAQETLTFKAYVTDGADTLSRVSKGKNYWSGLTIQFIAMSPYRT